MVLNENEGPTIDTSEKETTLPSVQSPEHQSANIASVSYNHNLAMQETQAYPGEGSMQYAFTPDGTLITGPILMSDPHTGHIICSNCWTLKVEASFRTSGPYSFLNPMCLDCERVYEVKAPPSSLGKRHPEEQTDSESTKRTKKKEGTNV